MLPFKVSGAKLNSTSILNHCSDLSDSISMNCAVHVTRISHRTFKTFAKSLANMGVTKQQISPGNGVDKPKAGDTITMEYTGNLFDESKPNKKGQQ